MRRNTRNHTAKRGAGHQPKVRLFLAIGALLVSIGPPDSYGEKGEPQNKRPGLHNSLGPTGPPKEGDKSTIEKSRAFFGASGYKRAGAPLRTPAQPCRALRRAGLASRKEEAVMLTSPVIKGTEIRKSIPPLASKVPYCLPWE